MYFPIPIPIPRYNSTAVYSSLLYYKIFNLSILRGLIHSVCDLYRPCQRTVTSWGSCCQSPGHCRRTSSGHWFIHTYIIPTMSDMLHATEWHDGAHMLCVCVCVCVCMCVNHGRMLWRERVDVDGEKRGSVVISDVTTDWWWCTTNDSSQTQLSPVYRSATWHSVCLHYQSLSMCSSPTLSNEDGNKQGMRLMLCSKKSDAKIQITITMAHLISINYPLSSFNYCLSGTNIANFNKIHHIVSEQQLFKNGTQKQNFPIWKIPIRILTAESVTNDIILVTFLWRICLA